MSNRKPLRARLTITFPHLSTPLTPASICFCLIVLRKTPLWLESVTMLPLSRSCALAPSFLLTLPARPIEIRTPRCKMCSMHVSTFSASGACQYSSAHTAHRPPHLA